MSKSASTTKVQVLRPEHAKAIKATAEAEAWATELAKVFTPLHILADDTDNDEFLQGVEAIAKRHFGRGAVGIEDAVIERFALEHSDRRPQEIGDLYLDSVHSQVLAAFALGLAWGRREGPRP